VRRSSPSPRWRDCLTRAISRAHRECRPLPQRLARRRRRWSRSGRCRTQQHARTVELAEHFVRDRIFVEWNFFHPFACRLRGFSNSLGNFVGLTKPVSHPSIVVAGNNQGAEAETPAALHHFCAAIYKHDFLTRVALCSRCPFLPTRVWSPSWGSVIHELKL
jgi:hypothetical protein